MLTTSNQDYTRIGTIKRRCEHSELIGNLSRNQHVCRAEQRAEENCKSCTKQELVSLVTSASFNAILTVMNAYESLRVCAPCARDLR